MNRRRLIVASAAMYPALRAAQLFAAPPKGVPSDTEQAIFLAAVDGEKFKGKIGEEEHEVRLIGADAPEKENKDGNPECYFDQSTKRLTQLLRNHKIYLEKDQDDKDGKNRLWRHVWVISASGKVILANEFLLAEGDVVTRPEDKNTKYHDRYAEAEKSAKSGNMGLWGTCGSAHAAITPVPRHGSGDDPGAVGETLEADGLACTLTDPFFTYDYNYSAPKGGYVFLIVNIAIKNVDDEKHGYDSMRFSAKDLDTGADFDDTFVLLDQPLQSGELSAGEYVSGQVALEVQETAVRIRVKYDVSAIGGDNVYWLVTKQ